MQIIYKKPGTIKNDDLTYAIIVSRYNGKWVFVQHESCDTWELPAGHREPGENIHDAAKRELFEETGATAYTLSAVFDYSVIGDMPGNGRLFFADIQTLGPLPNFEIARIDFFDDIPNNLTYPNLQPDFFYTVLNTLKTNH